MMLRLQEVMRVTGLSKATIYAMSKRGDFPRAVKLGPQVVAWPAAEVNQWCADKITASRTTA